MGFRMSIAEFNAKSDTKNSSSLAHPIGMLNVPSSPPSQRSLPEVLGNHARRYGERVAATFVNDDRSECSWTYRELWARACRVAKQLPPIDQAAPRALLLFPPGLEFLAGFLGCQIAGWVPVPTCYPKPGREMPRLDSAARDCAPLRSSPTNGRSTGLTRTNYASRLAQYRGSPPMTIRSPPLT